jgi:CHAT domain-containing protein
LIDGVCRARFSLGQDLDAMIALAVLESGSSTPHQPTAPLSQGAPLLKPLTILFMAANPDTSNSLALDEEARSIETKLRASNYRDAVRFRTRWAVRPDDFLQAFNEDRPAIVHFSGHGAGASGLVLHDGASGVRLVPAAALRRLFSTMKDEIRVVVLNACYSAEQADKIAEVIDCVVGMTDTVGDEAAKMFAASFYRAIAFGRDVKNAFEQGLAAVELEGLDEQDIPTLIVRSGVDPSKVVLIS